MNEMLDAMKENLEENLQNVAEDAVEEAVTYSLSDLTKVVLENSDDIDSLNNMIVDIAGKVGDQKPGVTKKDVALISGAVTLGGVALVAGGYLGYKYVLKPWMDKKKAPQPEVVADQEAVDVTEE